MVKVLTPEEALKAFMSKGNVREVEGNKQFNPMMRLQNDKGEQLYLHGVLLKRREGKSSFDPAKPSYWYTFKVISTNAKASERVKKDEYKDILPTAGMVIDIQATTTLESQLRSLTPGNEVFIQYLGKAAKAEKGRQRAHLFKVVESPAEAVAEEPAIIGDEE